MVKRGLTLPRHIATQSHNTRAVSFAMESARRRCKNCNIIWLRGCQTFDDSILPVRNTGADEPIHCVISFHDRSYVLRDMLGRGSGTSDTAHTLTPQFNDHHSGWFSIGIFRSTHKPQPTSRCARAQLL